MTDNRWRHFSLHTAKTTIETFRQINKHRTTEEVVEWMKDHFMKINGDIYSLRIYVDGIAYNSVMYNEAEKRYAASQELKP